MFGIQMFLQQGSANLLWKCAEKDNAEVRILTLHLQFNADFRKIIFLQICEIPQDCAQQCVKNSTSVKSE